MRPLEISVIIPTYNRPELLARVIQALLPQVTELGGCIEIIVVDDGSTMDVLGYLSVSFDHQKLSSEVRYIQQTHKGPAAARNRGIKEARAPIVLFLGDDIIPLPGLLYHHIAAHKEYPEESTVILGLADLAPEISYTPFVKWWQKWNYRYSHLLSDKCKPDYSFFYTNNVSAKKTFLIKGGLFDETFTTAAYEDTELGVRLARLGMRIVFRPQAKAYHYHPMDLREACRRMVTRGKAFDMFLEKTRGTGAMGISRLWLAAGSGFWMSPGLIHPLFKIAVWAQRRVNLGPVYLLVLMYCFQVGRGKKPLLPEMC